MYPLGRTDTIMHEVAMWKLAAERLGAEGALDVGIPKSRGEFLVNGIAFAPGGVPHPAVPVRATVGEVQKDLAVYGDRYWTGRSATEPRPFTQMPINWAHAFGGESHAENPFGKGVDEVEIEGVRIVPLPNIESKHELISSPRDRPLPAGFGPIDIGWPQRQRLAGTHDQHWLENLFPGFARDIDWEIHNAAAPDQRRQGFWEGGERFRFDNLHPTKVVEGEIPNFRARVFVSRSHARGQTRPPGPELKQMVRRVPDQLEEIPLALQTLWFFPDVEIGVLIWTGSTQVAEELGEDILHILLAAEHADRPRSIEHYMKVVAARLDPKLGAIALLKDDDLLPEALGPVESPLDADGKLGEFENFRMQNLHQRHVELTEAGRAEIASYGLDPDEHGPPVVPPLEPPPSPQELHALIEKSMADQAKAEIEAKEKLAKSQAEIEALVDGAAIEGFYERDIERGAEADPGRPADIHGRGDLEAAAGPRDAVARGRATSTTRSKASSPTRSSTHSGSRRRSSSARRITWARTSRRPRRRCQPSCASPHASASRRRSPRAKTSTSSTSPAPICRGWISRERTSPVRISRAPT